MTLAPSAAPHTSSIAGDAPPEIVTEWLAFQFLRAKGAPERLQGEAMRRGRWMWLIVAVPEDDPYRIVGSFEDGCYHGVHHGGESDPAVEVSWAWVDDAYLGSWREEGELWLFRATRRKGDPVTSSLPDHRRCSRCGASTPLGDFPPYRWSVDGRDDVCTPCHEAQKIAHALDDGYAAVLRWVCRSKATRAPRTLLPYLYLTDHLIDLSLADPLPPGDSYYTARPAPTMLGRRVLLGYEALLADPAYRREPRRDLLDSPLRLPGSYGTGRRR